jgi:hypothetical protein
VVDAAERPVVTDSGHGDQAEDAEAGSAEAASSSESEPSPDRSGSER